MPLYREQFAPGHDFPAMESVQRYYVICSTARSGSHLLGHLLKQTGKLGFPLEYFNKANLREWQARFGTEGVLDTYARIKQHRTSPNGCFGCKLHFTQFRGLAREFRLDELFPVEKTSFILIRRMDILGQAISLAIARQTGQWISAVEPVGEARYNRDLIDRCMKEVLRDTACWIYTLARRGLSFIEMTYEEICANKVRAVTRVADHIGVDLGPDDLPSETGLPQRQKDPLKQQWRERFLRDTESLDHTEEIWCLRDKERQLVSRCLSEMRKLAKRTLRRGEHGN